MHNSYGQDYNLTRSLIAILNCWHTSYRSNNGEVPKFNTQCSGCEITSGSGLGKGISSAIAGADLGGGQGGPMPPPSGLSRRETRRFATRLAHVATISI